MTPEGANEGSPQGGTVGSSTEDEKSATLSRLTLENTILWQGPALALAAEAFLLTIALGQDSTRFARIVSSVLGALTAAAAFYLVTRKGRHVQALKGELNLQGARGPRASTVWKTILLAFFVANGLIIWIAAVGHPAGWL